MLHAVELSMPMPIIITVAIIRTNRIAAITASLRNDTCIVQPLLSQVKRAQYVITPKPKYCYEAILAKHPEASKTQFFYLSAFLLNT
jgi:hypothetical protein